MVPPKIDPLPPRADIRTVIAILKAANWSATDSRLVERYAQHWQLSAILDHLYAKAFRLPDETLRDKALALLEKYAPPGSLLKAAEAMTVKQKAQISTLLLAGIK